MRRCLPPSTTTLPVKGPIMAQTLSEKMAEWIKANAGKHLCRCGCGRAVVVGPRHFMPSRGIPKFVRGHQGAAPLPIRFWPKVCKGQADDCWEWTGCLNRNGYGHMRGHGNPLLAHRASWLIARGPIPGGADVLHSCDNRRCVNPAHLWLGTHQDNMADMVAKGRQAKGEACSRKGEAHHAAKLTNAIVTQIRARYAAGGVSQRALGAEYGVSQRSIHAVIKGECWKGGAV